MKPFVFCACLCLLFSCKEKKSNATTGPVATSVHDSTSLSPDSGKLVFIERAGLELKHYTISVQTKFLFPDTLSEDSSTYSTGNFLFVYDKNKRSTCILKPWCSTLAGGATAICAPTNWLNTAMVN